MGVEFLEMVTDNLLCRNTEGYDLLLCILVRIFQLNLDILLALLAFQVFYIYGKVYRVNLLPWKNQDSSNSIKIMILELALVAALYNAYHYQLMKEDYRARMFLLVEILRTLVMAVIVFYYLKMASEEILRAKQYQCFKVTLLLVTTVILVFMLGGWLTIMKWLSDVNKYEIYPDDLCVLPIFRIFRVCPVIISLIFLGLAFVIQIKLA